MSVIASYLLFLAKTITFVIALLFAIAGIIALATKNKGQEKTRIKIKHLNQKYSDYAETLNTELLSKEELKKLAAAEKKAAKKAGSAKPNKKRVFLIHFNGDMRAQAVGQLREEITALLNVAKSDDEVVVTIESPGGLVHAYGLAASQLQRIKQKCLKLTVCIDKVAASGGYMMACVADQILSAPFAIVGSIGVVAQIPNFNRLLKKHDIDIELMTAGEYKRTLTLFGHNTESAREKFQEQIDETHELFKAFVKEQRPIVDLEAIATGEYWYGKRAIDLNLVDHLQTSDDYLLMRSQHAEVYEISFKPKKSLMDKLGFAAATAFNRVRQAWHATFNQQNYF